MKKGAFILILLLIITWLAVGCSGIALLQSAGTLPEEIDNLPSDNTSEVKQSDDLVKPCETNPDELNSAETSDPNTGDIRDLFKKGAGISNISYIAKFNNVENEYVYEYYKRGNLIKTVIRDDEAQSITVSDGNTTIYYTLPEKTGITRNGSWDDMEGIIPSTEDLLSDTTHVFRLIGEEQISDYWCQVVEIEEEYGALKIWISKTLGLPVKYIGTDDAGWYSLVLTDIQLGEPSESIFVIPSDIALSS